MYILYSQITIHGKVFWNFFKVSTRKVVDKCKITGKNNQKLGRPISNHFLTNQIPQLVKCQQELMATIKNINNSS